jgi:carbamoyl-phosphate synthase large subunit
MITPDALGYLPETPSQTAGPFVHIGLIPRQAGFDIFENNLGTIALGPEMRSTGEVMGVSDTFAIAFAKSQIAAGILLPEKGRIFISVASPQAKQYMINVARRLITLGFELLATAGTGRELAAAGIPVEVVKKLQEGHPNLIDHLIDGRVQLIFNTPRGKGARTDEGRIRAASVLYGVPCITTLPAAEACVRAMEGLRTDVLAVQPIQDRFPEPGVVSAAATGG